jgi:hypothetical protein
MFHTTVTNTQYFLKLKYCILRITRSKVKYDRTREHKCAEYIGVIGHCRGNFHKL